MKLLIVVDMQNDFVTGALRNEDAIAIVKNVRAKVGEYAMAEDCRVIFTLDTHNDDYLETEEGKNLPIPHCIRGTKGHRIIDELAYFADRDNCVYKTTFGSLDLSVLINRIDYREEDVESIELIGLCTDICVIANAVICKSALPNIPIYVDASCCAGVTPESHDTAIKAMKSLQIHILNEGEEPWRKNE